jgi:hypothetical protein
MSMCIKKEFNELSFAEQEMILEAGLERRREDSRFEME